MSLIAKVGLPVLVEVLGGALSRIDNPVAKTAAKTLEHTQDVLARGDISPEQAAEANRHIERMAELNATHEANTITQVNESLRAEVASTDPYVRRMRPTFGYLMAITWSVQMCAIAYVIVFETKEAHLVIAAVESLSTIWAVALSVLGIYVFKRSEEKNGGAGGYIDSKLSKIASIKPQASRSNFNR